MASLVQPLPRFLLPQLSWKASVGKTAIRATLTSSDRLPARAFRQTIPATASLSYHARPRPLPQPSGLLRHAPRQRAFHASAPRRRDHHFDTLKFVQRLQSEGFTEEQSVAMMKVLNDVIEER